jgi:hypothetical protein
LTVEELAEAAVIDLGNDLAFDPDYRFFEAREQLLEILGSLVAITTTQPGALSGDNLDPFTPASAIQPIETVRLSHFSVQEYLLSDRLRQSTNPRLQAFSPQASNPDAYVCNSSLRYLHCYINSETRLGTSEDIAGFPLLSYVSQRWPTHYNVSLVDVSNETIISLVIRLLQEQNSREAWLKL